MDLIWLPALVIILLMILVWLIPAKYDPAMRLRKWSERDDL
jgi:hypothetical protein